MLPVVSRYKGLSGGNKIPGLSSVRHIQPYQGSKDAQDLLDLYAANINYRKINQYMRSPDHQSGVSEILNEFVKDGKKPINFSTAYQQEYRKLNSQNSSIPEFIYEDLPAFRQSASEWLEYQKNPNYLSPTLETNLLKFDRIRNYYGDNLLSSLDNETEFLNDIAHSIINYNPDAKLSPKLEQLAIEKARQLSSWQPLRQEAEQVVASIPHIQQAISQQPKIPTGDVKELANAWYELRDEDVYDSKTEHFRQILQQHGINEEQTPSKAAKFAKSIRNGEIAIDLPHFSLSRGLHFKSSNDYNNFKNSHKKGAIVEYPGFTSATTNQSIQDGYSNQGWEHPISIQFEQPENGYQAFDVNNPVEAEYVFAPNSRFEVLNAQTIPGATRTGVDGITGEPASYQLPEGLELIVRETNAPTQVQARTQSILNNLKAKKAQQLLNAHLDAVNV